jgi:hypothetical protein
MNDTQPATDLMLQGESDLVFELGGPAYRLMQRVGVIKGDGPSVARRSMGFIAIPWLPLLVFTVPSGTDTACAQLSHTASLLILPKLHSVRLAMDKKCAGWGPGRARHFGDDPSRLG